jgi:predicted NBD/HSP70 family sugar kinase
MRRLPADEGSQPAGRVVDVRRRNLSLVLDRIAARDPRAPAPSRALISAETGLTKASVSSLVADLLAAGLLTEVGLSRAGERGRPGVGLALNDGLGVLGLEINVDYLAAGVVDLTGRVRIQVVEERINSGRQPAEVLRDLADLSARVLFRAGQERLRVLAAGLAVPGLVDAESAVVLDAPNLGWSRTPLDLAPLMPPGGRGASVALSNEANSAALAELWYGHGSTLRAYLFISGEVGVGGGLVFNGELFLGPGGHAGEVGHVVVAEEGSVCSCGGRGCLETVAGQEAVFAAAGTAGSTPAEKMERLLTALEGGDPAAKAAVARAGHYLGIAAASSARLVDISAVVLGGYFSRLGPWLLPALRASLATHAPRLLDTADVVLSELPQTAALMGAAGSCIREVLANPHELLEQPPGTASAGA